MNAEQVCAHAGTRRAVIELAPGLAIGLEVDADGTLVVSFRTSGPAPRVRIEAPALEIAARGALQLSAGSIAADSRTHLDLRALGQVRLWGDDVVEADPAEGGGAS